MAEIGSPNNPTQPAPPVAAIAYLSGPRRGETHRLRGAGLSIGASADAAAEDEPAAFLLRRGATYELRAEAGHRAFVNGEETERARLKSGDVVEFDTGTLLRFRVYPPGSAAWKSMSEAFSDCLECARREDASWIGKTATFLSGAAREMLTQTAPALRILLAVVVALMIAIGGLGFYSLKLRRDLRAETMRINEISDLLAQSDREAIRADDLNAIRVELGGDLAEAERRLEALEARSEAAARVIEQASRSVVFLQGAFGFNEKGTGRPLRFAGSSGRPPVPGQPLVGFGGDGPLVESLYTGTAFVVSEDGLLMTNRHVAVPWDYQEPAQALLARGLEPSMRRFVGYLPGRESAFEVEPVAASPDADVALLRVLGDAALPPPLPLAALPPAPGDEVIVLGYPTGMRALLARADPRFVTELSNGADIDFWVAAQRLAAEGHIGALASRGIVGQVSDAAVVYDAETTQGGSGGPVLDLGGSVIAVNAAILPEFGGSNLGVPAARGLQLLLRADAAGEPGVGSPTEPAAAPASEPDRPPETDDPGDAARRP